MKKTMSVVASVALAASLTAAPAIAGNHDSRDAVATIAGIVALGILGAALADHQDDLGYEEYRHHPRLHPDENAVGACMHRAKRIVRKAGGHHVKLNNVNKIEAKANGNTLVVFHATGYYNFGNKRSRIRCTVKNHRVAGFDFN